MRVLLEVRVWGVGYGYGGGAFIILDKLGLEVAWYW